MGLPVGNPPRPAIRETATEETMPESHVLAELAATIESRKSASPDSSYTAKLLHAGLEKIGRKIHEEAGELVEAAAEPGEEGREHTIYEAGDLFYHALVLLAHRGISLTEVESELARRFGTSGLEEKASRSGN